VTAWCHKRAKVFLPRPASHGNLLETLGPIYLTGPTSAHILPSSTNTSSVPFLKKTKHNFSAQKKNRTSSVRTRFPPESDLVKINFVPPRPRKSIHIYSLQLFRKISAQIDRTNSPAFHSKLAGSIARTRQPSTRCSPEKNPMRPGLSSQQDRPTPMDDTWPL
jgi:hypothetical protein